VVVAVVAVVAVAAVAAVVAVVAVFAVVAVVAVAASASTVDRGAPSRLATALLLLLLLPGFVYKTSRALQGPVPE
jgi:hypothetical protein